MPAVEPSSGAIDHEVTGLMGCTNLVKTCRFPLWTPRFWEATRDERRRRRVVSNIADVLVEGHNSRLDRACSADKLAVRISALILDWKLEPDLA